ncbi:MAG: hypothetical protein PV344_08235 [Anaplasma sp.]|nr:hypothetical protein [Anaplasma sp.]
MKITRFYQFDAIKYCKRLNFRESSQAANSKLFAGSNFRESNVASVVLTYCANSSRDLFFAIRQIRED